MASLPISLQLAASAMAHEVCVTDFYYSCTKCTNEGEGPAHARACEPTWPTASLTEMLWCGRPQTCSVGTLAERQSVTVQEEAPTYSVSTLYGCAAPAENNSLFPVRREDSCGRRIGWKAPFRRWHPPRPLPTLHCTTVRGRARERTTWKYLARASMKRCLHSHHRATT